MVHDELPILAGSGGETIGFTGDAVTYLLYIRDFMKWMLCLPSTMN